MLQKKQLINEGLFHGKLSVREIELMTLQL